MSPTNPPDARYTLTDLADLAGVTPRTVRYYLAQGLLPTVGAAGPGAKYDDAHLARLALIRRLQRDHQPLAEIRQRLDSLDDATVMAIAADPEPSGPADTALDYIRRVTSPHQVAEAPMARAYRAAPDAVSLPPMPAIPPPDLATTAPPRVERSQWERIALGPDVELHIRRPLPRSTAKRVDRIIDIARDLLEEDQP